LNHYFGFSLAMLLLVILCMVLSWRRRHYRQSRQPWLLVSIAVAAAFAVALFVLQIAHPH
jgi:predicted membrane metal-binding protein